MSVSATTAAAPREDVNPRPGQSDASNSRHAAKSGRSPGAYEAGIDTARLLYRLHDERQQLAARELLGYRPQEISGVRFGYTQREEMLWVEGRVVQLIDGGGATGLLPAGALPDAQEQARKLLGALGLNDAREIGVSRVDTTVGVRFDTPAEGWAVMRGLLALDVPRRKTNAWWDQRGRPQTVYAATESGQPRERVYDKGAQLATAEPGTHLRFEAQQRFPTRDRTTAGWWTMERSRESHDKRFAAMGRAAEGVHVSGEAGLRATIRQLVADEKLGPTQARTLLGYIAAETVAIPCSARTSRRARSELRRLGLAQALDGADLEPVDVDLGAVFDELRSTALWRSS